MTKILIDKETVELAFEALSQGTTDMRWKAIESLRQALEQSTEQEPVAWMSSGEARIIHWKSKHPAFGDDWIPLYTSPPQPQEAAPRQWVGLTHEEIDLLEELYAPPVHPDFVNDADHCTELIRHIEDKLRSKNT